MSFAQNRFFRQIVLPRSSRISHLVLASSIIALAFVAQCRVASAATFTFSQFQQAVSGNPFVFDNDAGSLGVNSTFTITNLPVTFQFTVPNGYGAANTPIAATLSMTSVVDGLATPGFVISQLLKDVHLLVTANVPVLGQDKLLEVFNSGAGSKAILLGLSGGQVALESSDTTLGLPFDYASAFLNFSGATEKNYSLSLSSVTPPLAIAGNGYFADFAAAGTGTFAANAVPEPASLVLLVLGGIGLFFARRCRQSR